MNPRLVWRLFTDRRVPWPVKLVPILPLLYIIFIPDLIPDFILGLGQVDDLGIFLLGLKLFVNMAPKEVVAEHRAALSSSQGA